jgi:hypothetical protein
VLLEGSGACELTPPWLSVSGLTDSNLRVDIVQLSSSSSRCLNGASRSIYLKENEKDKRKPSSSCSWTFPSRILYFEDLGGRSYAFNRSKVASSTSLLDAIVLHVSCEVVDRRSFQERECSWQSVYIYVNGRPIPEDAIALEVSRERNVDHGYTSC